ncbi:hypothetical protein [Lentzea sp. NPDC004782]|uniref:hypothetical protein n=1 Tax=Lentzea sp. NPDC004782 TaxID=3154458 RepID=UPI0033B6B192
MSRQIGNVVGLATLTVAAANTHDSLHTSARRNGSARGGAVTGPPRAGAEAVADRDAYL